jgi:Alcohol dehydrogenase GroES-like domain
MQVAGIRRAGGRVEMIEVGEPRRLASEEVLLEVRAAGVANWDEFVRTGGWDVGGRPPMALGVEAAGTVLAAGQAVSDWAPGDAVMTHPVPLRDQGTWAPRLIAPGELLARKPPGASWEAAAAFPVPAITAEQVLGGALSIHAGEPLLIHGAGGVTGGLLAALAVLRGAEVIATAGPSSRQRVSALGARHVIDYHDQDWPEQARAITGGRGSGCWGQRGTGRRRHRDPGGRRRRAPGDHHLRPAQPAARHHGLQHLRPRRRKPAAQTRAAVRRRPAGGSGRRQLIWGAAPDRVIAQKVCRATCRELARSIRQAPRTVSIAPRTSGSSRFSPSQTLGHLDVS